MLYRRVCVTAEWLIELGLGEQLCLCIAVTIGCHGDARMPKQLIIEETELTHTALVIVLYNVVTPYLTVLLVIMALLDWHLYSGQP